MFAGWRDMNDYMRENKIDAVAPQMMAKGAEKSAEAKAKPEGEAKVAATEPAAEGAEKKPAKASTGKVLEPKGGHDS